MFAASYSISPTELWPLMATADAPQLIDARRRETFDSAPSVLPAAAWRDPAYLEVWVSTLDRSHPIAVACNEGRERSQLTVAELRARGFDARVLAGGYKGWAEAGLPLVAKAPLDRFAPKRPSVWVTRRRPKIDRIACPWLIRRFLDAEARILYVDSSDVPGVAHETGAAPFDIECVELSHQGPRCSFDTMLKTFDLEGDLALARLALIVRGADTARMDLAPEAAGLLAVSRGLSALAGDDDHGMLAKGLVVYDALYAWLRLAAAERRN